MSDGPSACSHCGEELLPRARFCIGCGRALPGRCPGCGEENPTRARFCLACGKALGPIVAAAGVPREPGREAEGVARKVVTVVFSDVTGSTSLAERLDPESVRAILSGCFDRMRAVLEAHGGTVEKFIGDAVVAVFGVPTVHEDDALRAVRAVTELRDELERLGVEQASRYGVALRFRTGVNTGEVVVGNPSSRESFATGDTMNTAARLEEAAAPGEILLGESTWQLVRDSVLAEPAGPLPLRGKSGTVAAWRLVALHAVTHNPRPADAVPLVGRSAELERLDAAYRTVVDAGRCRLVGVTGPPGIGKTRLVEEFLARLDGPPTVLRGHCLAYGSGITFWPVQEVIKAAAGIPTTDSAVDAGARVDALVADDEHRVLLVQRIRQMLGLEPGQAPTQEIFWAVRRLLELLAHRTPLVVVVEDLHWAEPTLLDLLDYLAGFGQGAPVLLVCTGRSELLEARPGWVTGEEVTVLALDALGAEDGDRLVSAILGAAEVPGWVRRTVAEVAEGNPLFVAEMLRMLVEKGTLRRDADGWTGEPGDPATMPITLEALLGARLDRLAADERAALQRGAVVGRSFSWAAVAALSAPDLQAGVGGCLQSLARRDFIAPQTGNLAEDSYRFRNALLRDAVYRGTPKRLRAELHERYAGWLLDRAGDRLTEYEEILGYHLEQAYRLRSELGAVDEAGRALADRAAGHLAAAGHRALAHGDGTGATALLRRTLDLWPRAHAGRVEAALALARARAADTAEQERAAEEAVDGARQLGDRRLEQLALLWQARLHAQGRPGHGFAAVEAAARDAIAVFTESADDAGLAAAYTELAYVQVDRCQAGAADEMLGLALQHDRAAGAGGDARLLGLRCLMMSAGPLPVSEGIRRCTALARDPDRHPTTRGGALVALALLESMRGQVVAAREVIAEAAELNREFSLGAFQVHNTYGQVELIAGDFAAAEPALREECRRLDEAGRLSHLSTQAAYLAHALVALGRDDDAWGWTQTSEEATDADDILSRVLWRSARAKLLARRGEFAAAEALARAAVGIAEGTDWLPMRGEAVLDLARVLDPAGRPEDAAAAAADARRIFIYKGHLAGVGAVETFLARARSRE